MTCGFTDLIEIDTDILKCSKCGRVFDKDEERLKQFREYELNPKLFMKNWSKVKGFKEKG